MCRADEAADTMCAQDVLGGGARAVAPFTPRCSMPFSAPSPTLRPTPRLPLQPDLERLPAEAIGRARDLMRRIKTADGAFSDIFLRILAPMVARNVRHPRRKVRPEILAGFARQWRDGVPRAFRIV